MEEGSSLSAAKLVLPMGLPFSLPIWRNRASSATQPTEKPQTSLWPCFSHVWQLAESHFPRRRPCRLGLASSAMLTSQPLATRAHREPQPLPEAASCVQWPQLFLVWHRRASCLILMQTRRSVTGRRKSLQASGRPLPLLSALDRAVLRFGLLMTEKLRWERLWKSETEVWDKCSWIASYGACSHPWSFVIAKNGALQIPWRDWRQTYASHHQEVCLDSQPRSQRSVHYLLLLSSSPPLTSFP